MSTQSPPIPRIDIEIVRVNAAAGDDATYRAIVKDSTGGEIGEPRTFTLDPGKLVHREIEHALEEELKRIQGETMRQGSDPAHPATHTYDQLLELLKDYGQRLYRYLFDPDAWRYFLKYDHDIRFRGARLMLKLHESAYPLWNLAWEYAHDGEEFLATSGQFLFLRGVAGLGDLTPSSIAPPLRILAIIASPIDCDELNTDHEISLIHNALEEPLRRDLVLLEVLDDATHVNFRAALAKFRPHILYYTGHGGTTAPGRDASYLCLEREEDAKTDPLTPSDLLRFMHRAQADIRLVFLNGCRTARTGTGMAFSGLATTLLRAEVPIVIANQFSVSDSAATIFAGALFAAIGKGQSIEEAVDAGRQAMRDRRSTHGTKGLDWGIPTAYIRSPGLQLLETGPLSSEAFGRSTAVVTASRPTLVSGALSLPPHWVGRKPQLRDIRKALRSYDVATVYIWGFSGIGKSSLAAKVVETINRITGHFDAVFVFQERTSDAWKLVPTRLGEWLEVRGEPSHADAGSLLKDIHGTPSERLDAAAQLIAGKRYLFIFDNFEAALQCVDETHQLYNIADALEDSADLQAGRRPLRAFFTRLLELSTAPGVSWRHKCLFVSRYRWAAAAARCGRGDLEEIHLGPLTVRQALLLMDRKLRLKSLSFNDRLSLYTKVGGHPKTIELLDGYLVYHTIAEFDKNPDFDGLAADNPDAWNYTFVKELVARLAPAEQEVLKNMAILEYAFDDAAFNFFCERAGINDERSREELRAKLVNLSLLELW